MPQATLIMIASLEFAGVAISTGWQEAYPSSSCASPEYIIRYLPLPEPQPIYPAPRLLTVDEIGPPKAEPVVAGRRSFRFSFPSPSFLLPSSCSPRPPLREAPLTRLLVTGGRNYGRKDMEDRERAIDALDAVHEQHGITLVMQGGATGADSIARAWARIRNIPSATYEADWDRFGGSAGPIRNERMLADSDWNGLWRREQQFVMRHLLETALISEIYALRARIEHDESPLLRMELESLLQLQERALEARMLQPQAAPACGSCPRPHLEAHSSL